MKRSLCLIALGLLLVWAGCASFSGGNEFDSLDSLLDDSAWNIIEVLWNNYDDLDTAPMKTMAVYYFLEGGQISPLSDTLIEGLTTEIANAVAYEGVQVRVVSRTVLDRILEELSFQSSDLVDPQTQRSVGKQMGADLVVTGVIGPAEQGKKFNVQLVEVETGVVLGGFIKYLRQK